MSITQNILAKTKELSDVEFEYSTTSDFQQIGILNTDCTAIVMEATVIYFEIRNIDTLLNTGKRLATKVYKIYYNALREICQQTGGYLNCYSPKSFLLIYPKDQFDTTSVVKTAIKTADLFSSTLRDTIEKISHINFSIGIDRGNILGTKTAPGDNLVQSVWFGKTIEKAITISGLCLRPFFVGVSGSVYRHLEDDLRVTTKHILGIKKEVEIWTRMSYQFDNVKKHLYQTNFHLSFDDDK